MSEPKVGDRVRHIHRFREHSPGTVLQVGGGVDGQLTEVYWPDNDDALWHTTANLEFSAREADNA
ncbi:hypothetical protein H7I53_18125 [Mycolicibacterium pulveris]|uniref:Uncharacterized protein n=1 Tax=Mycolicibacterium pulveris TaxID=36813 RepID=A0A7I7UDB1_MYCPV|nr:hypothetical protein [Mycolicibacterium pulveris]MCV6982133.1 hypothetical protein [Mycolicibacterium pulveris]BBY78913.1 hypothetical protein MPUL_00710 [Mycolicibacterium pulveris]